VSAALSNYRQASARLNGFGWPRAREYSGAAHELRKSQRIATIATINLFGAGVNRLTPAAFVVCPSRKEMRGDMRTLMLALAGLALVACSMTLPVNGSFRGGAEPFNGEATGRMDGSGDLRIVSISGARCDGKFRYSDSGVSGSGDFSCSDGRTGTFSFTSAGAQGRGIGRTGRGETFEFSFGHIRPVTIVN
jgi:hypothetical protein